LFLVARAAPAAASPPVSGGIAAVGGPQRARRLGIALVFVAPAVAGGGDQPLRLPARRVAASDAAPH